MPEATSAPRHVAADIAVIGAGPVGLFAAYYAGFRSRTVAVIDALPVVGGQVTAMYPEKAIHDVAGFPAIPGRELIAGLELQASQFDPQYVLGERAESIEHGDGNQPSGVRIHTDQGTVIDAGAVIIASGVGGFTPRPLPSGTGLKDHDVAHFVTAPTQFQGRDAVIVGGGDSALDWALTLYPIANSVTVVHRRADFRAHEHSVASARQAGIRLLTRSKIVGSRYGTDLESVTIHRDSGNSMTVPCHRVIAALGFTAALGPLLTWDLGISDNRHIPVDSTMSTIAPRIFAAGDITTHPGKVPLIAVGFGEAATAVSNACRLLDPAEPLFGGHSTDRAMPAPAVGAR
ncbi:NAD(P)/FAD-dependent oxidoreductase [Mycobacterium sp. NPDC003449]